MILIEIKKDQDLQAQLEAVDSAIETLQKERDRLSTVIQYKGHLMTRLDELTVVYGALKRLILDMDKTEDIEDCLLKIKNTAVILSQSSSAFDCITPDEKEEEDENA